MEKLHNEVKALAATEPTPAPPEEIIVGAGAFTVLRESAATMDEQPIRQEKGEAPQISPSDLIAESQIIDERIERAAVTDGTGLWRASDELINAVIAAESGGNPNAVSKAGAVGLLQILPSTARDPGFGVTGLEGTDEEVVAQLEDPEINRRLGSEYLSALLHRYHGDTVLALVAYNAGSSRADRAAKAERPLDKICGVEFKSSERDYPLHQAGDGKCLKMLFHWVWLPDC